MFWVLISAVPVAVAAGADAPQVKRVLILHAFGRDFAPFSVVNPPHGVGPIAKGARWQRSGWEICCHMDNL